MKLNSKHNDSHNSIFNSRSLENLKKSGHYEVWYSMFNDTENNIGFWIRYAVLIPRSNQRNDKGNGILWFGYSDLENPNTNFMMKKFYPLNEVEGTTEDHIIKIGNSALKINSMKGIFKIANGQSVSWDLKLSDFLKPYNSTPKIFKTLRLTNTLNIGTHPNVRFDGIITIDEREIEIKNSRGLQFDTYGDSYTTEWQWMNAHNFNHHRSAFLDFGYKADKGVMEYFNGEKRISTWNNGFISKFMSIKKYTRNFTPTLLEFSTFQKGVKIT